MWGSCVTMITVYDYPFARLVDCSAAELILVVGPANFGLDQYAAPVRHAADYSNTAELGGMLYTVYMYPFEIAAVILPPERSLDIDTRRDLVVAEALLKETQS